MPRQHKPDAKSNMPKVSTGSSINTIKVNFKVKKDFFLCSNALEYIDGMANSVDPDQTLILVCTVCSGLSVPENFTVLSKSYKILI